MGTRLRTGTRGIGQRSWAWLAGLLLVASCANVTNAGVSQPSAPASALDLSVFSRVWIAGFITNPNKEIDVNAETVRLLRSQLRSRIFLRVVDAEPIMIDGESMLRDAVRWRSLAEEYGAPLIVTGAVRLSGAPPVATERPSGRGSAILRRGFVLDATFVFIDGHTGEIVHSETLPKEKAYGADDRASPLSLYFRLMDRVLPRFLRTFGLQSALQSVRGESAEMRYGALVLNA